MKDLFKIIASFFIKVLLLPIYLFPINSKRIVFMSYSGLQYSCNPKYISKFIEDNNFLSYQLIWVFLEPEKITLSPNIKKVKYLSFLYFYYVITSKYCISNTGFNRFFIIRRNQRFIQTWHGGGAYKKRSINQSNTFCKKILDRQHDDMITDFLSTSEYFTKYFINDSVYKGNILNIGMPRNSFLLKNSSNTSLVHDLKNKLSTYVHINYSLENKLLVLYAPTWRDDNSTYNFPNFERILKDIKKKFNKEPILLLRSHHFQELSKNLKCNFLDVCAYDDMQELLLIVDVLISDYSSSIWDFSLLKKPCFLYTPDLEYYERLRGFYIPIRTWGFDVCCTSDELQTAISLFDLDKYKNKIEKMHKTFHSFENKYSTELLLENMGIYDGKY
ncbi:CDP-glycerol glycerophosphotransferase family protein [Gallibacterium anatis]|nr:CDP-glycerol glycerophosphotransferase family protein [Gallibacterium anatis]